MDSIRIENLRSLLDTGFIDIKPISLLVGRNNSGKSSFLRIFPLFRQSVESRTRGPILWNGNYVDFGDMNESVWNGSAKKEITFHFKIKLPKDRKPIRRFPQRRVNYDIRILEDLNITFSLVLSVDGKGNTYAKSCTLCFADQTIFIAYETDHLVSKFTVNSLELADHGKINHYQTNSFIPVMDGHDIELDEYLIHLRNNTIKKIAHHKTSHEIIKYISDTIGIGSTANMYEEIVNNRYAGETWRKRLRRNMTEGDDFKEIRDLVIASYSIQLMEYVDSYVNSFFRNIYYIAPLRASAERYYRIQDLAVDEVDFKGVNLPMFIRSLSESQRERFKIWTKKYFGFVAGTKMSGQGHLSLTVTVEDDLNEYNLTDTGFGFSQILPVVTQLWLLSSRKRHRVGPIRNMPLIYVIEQPELHLHPQLQAKLADAFIASIETALSMGIDLRLIIETHSEAIINRIGQRVSNKNIKSDLIGIYFFEKERPDDPTQIRKSNYDDDGYLVNWPIGFFDPNDTV